MLGTAVDWVKGRNVLIVNKKIKGALFRVMGEYQTEPEMFRIDIKDSDTKHSVDSLKMKVRAL